MRGATASRQLRTVRLGGRHRLQQTADADWTACSRGFTPFVTAHNHYSLLERTIRHEMLPACRRFGLGLLPYFPLASGLLPGKYRRDAPPPQDRVQALTAFAESRGRSLLELAFCWLLSQPEVVSVIAGATSPEQVAANVAAARDWRLTADEMRAVTGLLET